MSSFVSIKVNECKDAFGISFGWRANDNFSALKPDVSGVVGRVDVVKFCLCITKVCVDIFSMVE